jgi:hypothetical protein
VAYLLEQCSQKFYKISEIDSKFITGGQVHFSIKQGRQGKIAKAPVPTKFSLCIQHICHLHWSHS